jgi:hypothetical protein
MSFYLNDRRRRIKRNIKLDTEDTTECYNLNSCGLIWTGLDSSVGIATGLQAGLPGLDFRKGQVIFLYPTASRPALGLTQPSVQWVPGALFQGVKRPWREADPSPSSAPRSRMVELYLHSSWHNASLIKHGGSFTVYIYLGGFVGTWAFVTWCD